MAEEKQKKLNERKRQSQKLGDRDKRRAGKSREVVRAPQSVLVVVHDVGEKAAGRWRRAPVTACATLDDRFGKPNRID